jgi:DNA repair exonuclease SbcCD ATPase subunit
MLAGIVSTPLLLALIGGPLSMEEFAVAGSIVILLPLVVWLVYVLKLKRQRTEAAAAFEKLRSESTAAFEKLRSESGATLKALQAKAAADAAAAQKAADEAAAFLADIQQRFSTHREVSERRTNDASQQIMRLEGELASTREIAAQLAPTQSRIKDLEQAVASEQGRVKALEQTVETTAARAADFEQRLMTAQEVVLKHKAEMQEYAVELKKVRDEQVAYAAAGGAEAELNKAREAHQQAEVKIANLQRSLKAAEARVEMVQKEFMNAVGVGVAPPPAPGSPAAAASSDKRVRDLEEKLASMEAESRKKTREDGYKIAELEYRLSEALEASGNSPVKPAAEPPNAGLPPSGAPASLI